jgi:hypothetical protein
MVIPPVTVGQQLILSPAYSAGENDINKELVNCGRGL